MGSCLGGRWNTRVGNVGEIMTSVEKTLKDVGYVVAGVAFILGVTWFFITIATLDQPG